MYDVCWLMNICLSRYTVALLSWQQRIVEGGGGARCRWSTRHIYTVFTEIVLSAESPYCRTGFPKSTWILYNYSLTGETHKAVIFIYGDTSTITWLVKFNSKRCPLLLKGIPVLWMSRYALNGPLYLEWTTVLWKRWPSVNVTCFWRSQIVVNYPAVWFGATCTGVG